MVNTPYIINEIYDILQKSSPFELTLEALLALGVIWIVFYKRTTKKMPMSEEEILARWTPEPLVAEVPQDHPALKTKIVEGPVGKMVNVNGKECINMATHNYLGLAEDEDIKQAAIKSLRKYGVGSCGPRGFYGTVDVHLELEERLAKFMNVEEAVKTEVDLVSAGLEWSAATIGGFCAGSSFIVEHQRLSGLGYCFSASLPPLLAQAAISALDRFESNPRIFVELRERCRMVSNKLSQLKHFQSRGDPLSPVKHLYLKHKHESWAHEKMLLDEISTECIDNGLAVIAAEYLETMEKHCPRPSIRLTVNRLLTEKEIDDAFRILEHVSEKVFASAG
uniref:Serine palmitoyltransferase 1 n=1 Tax=Anopheles coluzzii TaxID=1518534 RepID=A0A8W7Q149_ANOCL